jgi:hypothetical protein
VIAEPSCECAGSLTARLSECAAGGRPADEGIARALAAPTGQCSAEMGHNCVMLPALIDALDAGLRGAPQPDVDLLIDALRCPLAGHALPVVRRYVGHEDPLARGAALTFLLNYGGPDDTEVLLPRLDQEADAELLEAVIDTLGSIGSTAAITALRALSRDARRAPHLRRAAINAANDLAFPATTGERIG